MKLQSQWKKLGLAGGIALAATMMTAQAQAASLNLDGGAAASVVSKTDNTVSVDAWSYISGANFGWTHSSTWHDLRVGGGSSDVSIVLKQKVSTDPIPAFSIFSFDTAAAYAKPNAWHQYNQVRGPNDTVTDGSNRNDWFLTQANLHIDGIVGYVNSSQTFTNADGDAVGHGAVFDASLPQAGTGANSHIADSGSWFTYGVEDGLTYVKLFLKDLAAGHYAIVDAGSLANRAQWIADGFTVPTTKSLNLTVSAVPVPGSVWLLGSAITGLVGISRRRNAAKA